MVSLQRSRLLGAAAGLLFEDGYGRFSVANVCTRAGVSRRTFYEIFEDREACMVALLAEVEARVQRAISGLRLGHASWSERIRMGLWAILCIAESHPALAKVFLSESQRAGGLAQAERERLLGRLVALVDEGRQEGGRSATAGALTAEALVGAGCSVIAARLAGAAQNAGVSAGSGRTDLRELLGELAGMIVLPYLGPAAARREVKRQLPASPVTEDMDVGVAEGPDPIAGLPMRLTYRTATVLLAAAELAQDGVGVSNRQIAERAGVADPGQISKLLARLERYGLLVNAAKDAGARGEANRWTLTRMGERLVRGIGVVDAKHARWSAA